MSVKQINSMQDISELTPDEFHRFLPDLVAWHRFARLIRESGGMTIAMEWSDDGLSGVVTHVDFTVGDTTERIEVGGGVA